MTASFRLWQQRGTDMIEYAGTICTDLKLNVKNLINVPCPADDLEEIEIPGRDGVLVKSNKRKKPIEIGIDFNYITTKDKWHEVWRKAKKWLSQKNQKLILDDNTDYYYRCKYVKIETNERLSLRIGGFTATFVCDPYQYLNSEESETLEAENYYITDSEGNTLLDSEGNEILTHLQHGSIENPYDTSCPLYKMEGTGICNLYINGNPLEAEVSGEITIDTYREVAYKGDGTSANTDVTCTYADLVLKEGENLIEKTDYFTMEIIPQWREI